MFYLEIKHNGTHFNIHEVEVLSEIQNPWFLDELIYVVSYDYQIEVLYQGSLFSTLEETVIYRNSVIDSNIKHFEYQKTVGVK